MRAFLLLLACGLSACSPYAAELKRLDREYAAGRIPFEQYRQRHNALVIAEQNWQANAQARAAAGAAYIQRQQELNAYNQRTWALRQPQSVNVRHSGSLDVYHY